MNNTVKQLPPISDALVSEAANIASQKVSYHWADERSIDRVFPAIGDYIAVDCVVHLKGSGVDLPLTSNEVRKQYGMGWYCSKVVGIKLVENGVNNPPSMSYQVAYNDNWFDFTSFHNPRPATGEDIRVGALLFPLKS